MLNLFSLRRLPWVSDGQEKVLFLLTPPFLVFFCFVSLDYFLLIIILIGQVELSAAELESLRSELSELEERESYLKAQ